MPDRPAMPRYDHIQVKQPASHPILDQSVATNMLPDRPPTAQQTKTAFASDDSATRLPAAGQWPAPRPLAATTSQLWPEQALDGTALDQPARDIVGAIGVAPAISGLTCLSAIACAIGGKFNLEIASRWHTTSNLYIFIAAPPGSRKSPAYQMAFSAILQAKLAATEAHRRDDYGRISQIDVLVRMRSRLIREAADNPDADLQALIDNELALAELRDNRPHTLLYDDLTAERLAVALTRDNGRINVSSDEAGNFEGLISGRYSGGTANIDPLLKGYDGGSLQIDRMGRPAISVTNAVINIALLGQPEQLHRLLRDSVLTGRGFWDRFLLAHVTDLPSTPNPAFRHDMQQWDALVRRLLGIPTPPPGRTPTVTFTTDARALLARTDEKYRQQARDEHSDIARWLSKHPTRLARIAGLLHAASQTDNDPRRWPPIPTSIVEQALRLDNYLISQAKQLQGGQRISAQQMLLDWLRGRTEFTARQAREDHRTKHPQLATENLVAAAIRQLTDAGWIRLRTDIPHGPRVGRPPSPTYDVHPTLH